MSDLSTLQAKIKGTNHLGDLVHQIAVPKSSENWSDVSNSGQLASRYAFDMGFRYCLEYFKELFEWVKTTEDLNNLRYDIEISDIGTEAFQNNMKSMLAENAFEKGCDFTETRLAKILNVDSYNMYDSDGSLEDAVTHNLHSILREADVMDDNNLVAKLDNIKYLQEKIVDREELKRRVEILAKSASTALGELSRLHLKLKS